MTSVSYERLVEIISCIPKTITKCGLTRDFIMYALAKKWDRNRMEKYNLLHPDYYLYRHDIHDYEKKWIVYKYTKNYISQRTINEIDKLLDKHGYLIVILYISSEKNIVDHTFVVCNTDRYYAVHILIYIQQK